MYEYRGARRSAVGEVDCMRETRLVFVYEGFIEYLCHTLGLVVDYEVRKIDCALEEVRPEKEWGFSLDHPAPGFLNKNSVGPFGNSVLFRGIRCRGDQFDAFFLQLGV